MAKLKIDWNSVASGASSLLRSNAGTILGGFTMIGMALICRKLKIPYQVLSGDPFSSFNYKDTSNKTTVTVPDISVIMAPDNTVEASIATICDNARLTEDNWYKNRAVDQILDILKNSDEVDDKIKTYAVMCIRTIAAGTNDDWYRNRMLDKVAKIAKDEL